MALHYDCLPTTLDEDQITDYLHLLQQEHNTPSDSYFKHTVYGLRMLCKVEGLKASEIGLPSIKKTVTKGLPNMQNLKDVHHYDVWNKRTTTMFLKRLVTRIKTEQVHKYFGSGKVYASSNDKDPKTINWSHLK